MRITGIDHLHTFQDDLEGAINFLSNILGNRWFGPLERPIVNVKVAFSDGGLEGVEPMGQDKFGTASYLAKHGPGLASIGLKVPELDAAVSELEARGIRCMTKTAPNRTDIGLKAAVFDPDSCHGIKLELLQYNSTTPMAVASLNWAEKMPWAQAPIHPKSATGIRVGSIDHLNLFQYDLEDSVRFFADIWSAKWIGPIERPELKFRMAFSDIGINIIQPTGQDRLGITDYMKQHGEIIGSVGYKVPDLEAAISELESKGVRLINRVDYSDKPHGDLKAAVFDPASAYGIMFEIVEYQASAPVALANLNWNRELPWMLGATPTTSS